MSPITVPLLPITFVTKAESNNRSQWFDHFKLPILDIVTLLQERVQENRKLNFDTIQSAIDFFEILLSDIQDADGGIRVYFASPSADGTVTEGKCGLLTLIFGATKDKSRTDIKTYYAFNGRTFSPVTEDLARAAVHNYQKIKREILFQTLSKNDRLQFNRETKHIWFSKKQIEQTLDEMKYQVNNHGDKVTGLGIRFVSYTDLDYQSPLPGPFITGRLQRLTIAFSFMNTLGLDIGIEDIDPLEFVERFKLTEGKAHHGDTFDTGDPTPPPSTENRAELDASND